MKYFIDTEFHEYKKQPTVCGVKVGKPIDTIELISIGIVSEDFTKTLMPPCDVYSETVIYDREYYAICKEFDLKAAWNNEWLKENVLKNLFNNSIYKEYTEINTFKEFKKLIYHFGKTKKQIAEEIKEFVGDKPEFYAYGQDKGFVFINFMKNYGSL